MGAQDLGPSFRVLGQSEAFFWLLGQANCGNGMIVAELSGQLTVERLQRALERAQQRHPLLRARIRRMGLRLAVELETPPNPIPLSVNRLPEWQDEVTRWMDTPFPVGRGPLMRCLWFCDEGPEAVFALVFSHMICDGLAAVSLTR